MTLIASLIGFIYLVLVCLWVCGALYFDLGQESLTGIIAVLIWIAFVVLLAIFFPLPISLLGITAALLLVLIWWFTLKPQQDRQWDPNFSKTCRIEVRGDAVHVENVRNTEYRSLEDYDVRYENRDYDLSNLTGADVLILFWGSHWLSHPMIIFDFGNDQHLCFSVEVRYRQGQSYNFLKGIYRQYELMYVVSDERDAILRRTKHAQNQDCYLYRLRADQSGLRQLFMEYAEAVNELAEKPQWYHAITDNCTTSVIKRRVEKVQFDLRFYMNGSLDRLLYDRELINTSLPFEELKKRSLINRQANEADAADFSRAIRRDLPEMESE